MQVTVCKGNAKKRASVKLSPKNALPLKELGTQSLIKRFFSLTLHIFDNPNSIETK